MKLDFLLPGFNFFEEGNTWTGSCTKDRATSTMIRMRIVPDKENHKLLASLWKNQDLCYEKAQNKAEREGDFSAQGLASLEAWFTQEFQEL